MPQERATTGGPVLDKGHILIVETDDLIRQLLERWLSEAGYGVHADASGVLAPATAPDLVIVNVPRPRDAQELVQSLEKKYSAPILVVSARFRRGLGTSAEAARRLGVRKVLPKPFTREELLEAVEATLGGQDGPAA
jgi:DNA-binding response OmpR family regulator